MTNIQTSAAKAKLAKVQADLKEAQEERDDMEKEHYFELASDSLDRLKEMLQEDYDNRWENLSMDLETMVELLERANNISASNMSSISTAINELLKFYGITNMRNAGVDKAYASGSKRITSKHIGLSNEDGTEILVTKEGLISKFNPGDGVVPADLTAKLYNLAQNVDFSHLVSTVPNYSVTPANTTIEISQHYDALVNVEGSADAVTVDKLNKLSKDILEKSYEYTSNKINKDFVRTGGLRRV